MRIESTATNLLSDTLLPVSAAWGVPVAAQAGMLQATFATTAEQKARAREELVMQHVSLVRYVARQLHSKLPQHVDLDDLMSAGMVGLLDAATKFDGAKHVQFKSYAQIRVRGAILDSLRTEDWGSRELRRKGRAMVEATRVLSARLGRTPGAEEIAAEMGLDLQNFQELAGDLKGLELGSLNEDRGEDSEEQELDTISAPEAENPLARLLETEKQQQLAEAMQALPEKERLVLNLHLVEGLTLREIGLTLGVVESRVSQIRSAALKRLQRTLAGR